MTVFIVILIVVNITSFIWAFSKVSMMLAPDMYIDFVESGIVGIVFKFLGLVGYIGGILLAFLVNKIYSKKRGFENAKEPRE